MSVQLFVGPSKIGKTYTMREWLIPALLSDASQATQLGPADGFTAALISDPSTVEFPEGQYQGPYYDDVAEWRRAEKRSRVARFRNASLGALCEVGVQYGRLVLCLDDAERELGSERTPSPEATELITRGRLHGCVILGACRRMMAIHTSVRSNVEVVYFGGLTDENDRHYAAKTAGVNPEWLRNINQRGVLLEWRRATGEKSLIRVEARRKLIIRSL
jgi:hypothetical protein